MCHRRVKSRLTHAERLRGNRHPAALERPHGDAGIRRPARPAALGIDSDIAKLQVHAAQAPDAERVVGGTRVRSRRCLVGTRKALTPASAQAGLRRGEDDRHIGSLGVGDPDLPSR